MRVTVLTCLALVACGPWPDVGPEASTRDTGWPELLPLSQIIAGRTIAPAEKDEAELLAARAEALRARARILRANARNIDEMDALRSRLP